MKRSDLDTVTVLRIISEKPDDWHYWTADYLASRIPEAPPKVILAKLYQLSGLGLVEYGIHVKGAWLTADGRRKLAETESALREGAPGDD